MRECKSTIDEPDEQADSQRLNVNPDNRDKMQESRHESRRKQHTQDEQSFDARLAAGFKMLEAE